MFRSLPPSSPHPHPIVIHCNGPGSCSVSHSVPLYPIIPNIFVWEWSLQVIRLAQGLWLLLQCQYWTLVEVLWYPAAVLNYGSAGWPLHILWQWRDGEDAESPPGLKTWISTWLVVKLVSLPDFLHSCNQRQLPLWTSEGQGQLSLLCVKTGRN